MNARGYLFYSKNLQYVTPMPYSESWKEENNHYLVTLATAVFCSPMIEFREALLLVLS